jgi:two-component system, chemotaxis family, sensor kinase CheA
MTGPGDVTMTGRDATLSDAALQLLTALPGDAGRLREIRDAIGSLAADPAEASWVHDALETAVALLDDAIEGTVGHMDAAQRVGVLLELVMMGESSAPGEAWSATNSADFTMPPDAARELLPEFVAESLQYLEQAERALLELESNPDAAGPVDVVFRAFHTIKSTAAFLGLEPVSILAHTAESLLSHVRDGRAPFTSACADLTLHCADMMRTLVLETGSAPEGERIMVPAGFAALLDHVREAERQISGSADVASASTGPDPRPPERESTATGAQRSPTGGTESWVRVRTERLDQLLDLVGELVVAQSMIVEDPHVVADQHGTLGRKAAHTSKIVRELQEVGMSLRMVPMRALFQKVQRLVRDLARESGKRIELVTEGEDTAIDRNMVDTLTDPLVHMVRNAVDHAFEPPLDRAAAGKPEIGTLRLAAYHAGGSVVVELHDDGRGLDGDSIRARAQSKGLVPADRVLSSSETHALIFAPGLSTADEVTSLSGRGVGMDVVRRGIEALRGSIEIASAPGQGTSFTMRLPLTLAITDGMLIRVGTERYIIPVVNIRMSFRPEPGTITTVPGGGELVMLHGVPVPIVRLHQTFGVAGAATDPCAALLIVVVEAGRRYALLVDEVIGQQQFVAKSVGDGLGGVRGLAGAAILGDGCVGLILDLGALFDTGTASADLAIPGGSRSR